MATKNTGVNVENGVSLRNKKLTTVAIITLSTLIVSLASLVIGILCLIIKNSTGKGDIFFAYLMLMIIFNGSSLFLSFDTYSTEKRLIKINSESNVGKKKSQPTSSIIIAVAVCAVAAIITLILALNF